MPEPLTIPDNVTDLPLATATVSVPARVTVLTKMGVSLRLTASVPLPAK